jgi:hypothetical protein
VFHLRYELGFISQKMPFFIVTAVKTSNLMKECLFVLDRLMECWISKGWLWEMVSYTERNLTYEEKRGSGVAELQRSKSAC